MARPNSTFNLEQAAGFFETVKEILKTVSAQAPSFTSWLLGDDDPIVQKYLEHRVSAGAAKGWESRTINVHREN